MAIIIDVIENNNRLDFTSDYPPIVCGNSNYILKFTFSESWQKCNKKTCVFVVEDKKKVIDFEGVACRVPILPNGAFVFVTLISGEGDNQLISTPLKIRLEPTKYAGNMSEFNQTASYLPKVLAAVNDIKNGNVTAKFAESAIYSENAKHSTTAETANVSAVAQNVSNPNLLINGDFRVNQRGKTAYTPDVSNKFYTVDRWLLQGNVPKLYVNDDGTITVTSLNNYYSISQYIEKPSFLSGKTVTISAKGESSEGDLRVALRLEKSGVSGYEEILYPKIFKTGIQTISATAQLPENISDEDRLYFSLISISGGQSTTWHWAKLEVGSTATEFVPKLYLQELAMCQRYYQKIRLQSLCMSASSATAMYPQVMLCEQMRIKPTIVVEEYPYIRGNGINVQTTALAANSMMGQCLMLNVTGSSMTVNHIYTLVSGVAELDAEIY